MGSEASTLLDAATGQTQHDMFTGFTDDVLFPGISDIGSGSGGNGADFNVIQDDSSDLSQEEKYKVLSDLKKQIDIIWSTKALYGGAEGAATKIIHYIVELPVEAQKIDFNSYTLQDLARDIGEDPKSKLWEGTFPAFWESNVDADEHGTFEDTYGEASWMYQEGYVAPEEPDEPEEPEEPTDPTVDPPETEDPTENSFNSTEWSTTLADMAKDADMTYTASDGNVYELDSNGFLIIEFQEGVPLAEIPGTIGMGVDMKRWPPVLMLKPDPDSSETLQLTGSSTYWDETNSVSWQSDFTYTFGSDDPWGYSLSGTAMDPTDTSQVLSGFDTATPELDLGDDWSYSTPAVEDAVTQTLFGYNYETGQAFTWNDLNDFANEDLADSDLLSNATITGKLYLGGTTDTGDTVPSELQAMEWDADKMQWKLDIEAYTGMRATSDQFWEEGYDNLFPFDFSNPWSSVEEEDEPGAPSRGSDATVGESGKYLYFDTPPIASEITIVTEDMNHFEGSISATGTITFTATMSDPDYVMGDVNPIVELDEMSYDSLFGTSGTGDDDDVDDGGDDGGDEIDEGDDTPSELDPDTDTDADPVTDDPYDTDPDTDDTENVTEEEEEDELEDDDDSGIAVDGKPLHAFFGDRSTTYGDPEVGCRLEDGTVVYWNGPNEPDRSTLVYGNWTGPLPNSVLLPVRVKESQSQRGGFSKFNSGNFSALDTYMLAHHIATAPPSSKTDSAAAKLTIKRIEKAIAMGTISNAVDPDEHRAADYVLGQLRTKQHALSLDPNEVDVLFGGLSSRLSTGAAMYPLRKRVFDPSIGQARVFSKLPRALEDSVRSAFGGDRDGSSRAQRFAKARAESLRKYPDTRVRQRAMGLEEIEGVYEQFVNAGMQASPEGVALGEAIRAMQNGYNVAEACIDHAAKIAGEYSRSGIGNLQSRGKFLLGTENSSSLPDDSPATPMEEVASETKRNTWAAQQHNGKVLTTMMQMLLDETI